jgi:sugar diacid utilization regulator
LCFEQVRRTAREPLFNSLIQQHHYLGYTQPVGEHLKYLVFSGERVVAALAWSSAAHGLTCRDQFLGWSSDTRRKNRHLLAYNSRFLVPPWVRVPHLASHVLGRMVRRLSADWQRWYHHPIYFVETFVDPSRHAGSCYRAANWIVLGKTFGRGHRCPTWQANRPVKLVLGYPLLKRFRQQLAGDAQLMEVPSHEGRSASHRVG